MSASLTGFARVVAIDLHVPEIERFLQIPLEHLTAAAILAGAVRVADDIVIVAPDLGAVKLAERFQTLLHRPVAALHKTRLSGSAVSLRSVFGDVKGRAPLFRGGSSRRQWCRKPQAAGKTVSDRRRSLASGRAFVEK